MRTSIFIQLIVFMCQCQMVETPDRIRFYAGTSDGSLQKSIVLCELIMADGQITVIDSFGGAKSPSYLALAPGRDFLYAVDEEPSVSNTASQQVTGFSVDQTTGNLKPINNQSSEGTGPCHLSVHPSGKYLFTANYGSGTIAVHPINNDGSLSPACDIKQHSGSGPDTTRQEAAHAHFITADPGGNHVLAVDLGIDKIMNYVFDPTTGHLDTNPAQPFFSTLPGAGPRHLVFHPEGKLLFLVNELNGTLTSCSYDPEQGTIKEINTQSTLEEDFTGYNKSAAVRIHPDGQTIYASNRGDRNSISVFRIIADGSMEREQVQDQDINWPRDFSIDPSGRYLLVANQKGNSIVVFRIDPVSGKLESTGKKINLSQPTCILFL
jgi:6-phosphogluconolactonase